MLVKLIITQIITFNTDSGYNTEKKYDDSDVDALIVMMVTIFRCLLQKIHILA